MQSLTILIHYFISAGEKVLVVNGAPWDNGRRTEIIDLEDSSFTCSKVNQFPVSLLASAGGLVGSTPFVCGGWLGSSYSNACYTLQENGAWKQDRTASLNTVRFYAASGSVIMSNQLVIAGGHNGKYLSSIELASPNARTTTRGLRPIDFNINERQLRGRSGSFKMLKF